MKKWLVVAVGLVATLVGGYLLKYSSVSIVTPSYKEVPTTYQGEANVVAMHRELVKSHSTGPIRSYAVKVGDTVTKGQVLAIIDTTEMERQIASLESKLASLPYSVENEPVGSTMVAPHLEVAEELYKKGIITESEYGRLLSRQSSASATAVGTSARYDAERESLKRAIDRLRQNVQRKEIVSSMDGIVAAIYNSSQKVALQGQPFMLIQQESPALARLTVPNEVAKVLSASQATGQNKAIITVSDATIEGSIRHIDHTKGQAQSLVEVSFDNRDGTLSLGDFYTITLISPMRKRELVVPTKSIHQGDAGYYIYVLTEDHVVDARAVTIGASEKEETVILSGLSVEDRILISERTLQLGERISL